MNPENNYDYYYHHHHQQQNYYDDYYNDYYCYKWLTRIAMFCRSVLYPIIGKPT